MDFEFTAEQNEFRKQIARFVAERVTPQAERYDQSGEFPREILEELGELGYLGIKYPEQYGGVGLDQPHLYHTIFCEELARGSLGIAAGIAMHTSTATYGVNKWGTEELKQKYLVPALQGKMIAAFGLTEPNAGSDAAAIRTRAQRDGDHYVLNGTKIFTTNGTVADFITIAARTTPGKGFKGISLFLLDTKTPGFSVGRKLEKFTIHCSDTAELVLDNVRIPSEYLLGEEDMGLINIAQSLVDDRVMTAGLAIGVAKAAYAGALKYAQEREQFGKTISTFQAVRFRLVDMLARLKTAELYSYYAAWKADRGEKIIQEAAMAKLVASEAANYICRQALSIFGGYGLMMEYPAQRFLRDSFFPLVGGGTSDIMKVVISKEMGI
ncbi:MAG: acyl-CoA dehydrogenase family protein [Deltaproteobacteria bacterium]|nr:acyl-CoA dehydrogenase family protein [Deltaproteobacteria bacterium]